MLAKQLTVFIENRTGRLCEVLNVLRQNNVNILSLSLADTTVRIDYGRDFRGSLSTASAATVIAFEVLHQNK